MTWPYRGATYRPSDFLRWDDFRDDLRSALRPIDAIDRENVQARSIPADVLGFESWIKLDRTASDATRTVTQAASSRGIATFVAARREIETPEAVLSVYGRVDLEKASTTLGSRVVRASVGLRIDGRLEAIRHPVRGLQYQPMSVRVVRPVAAGVRVVELLVVIAEPYREASTTTPSDVSVDYDGFALFVSAMGA